MAAYDAFAEFYNRGWGQEYHAQLASVLERLLLRDLRHGASILDVGCGSGVVAAQLVARGFQVTGIDPSAAMLAFARQNAPGARFIQADARDFSIDRTVEASVATFEAMNHILDREGLLDAFRCIARATERIFVFDMNRESPYDTFWNGPVTVEQDGITAHLAASYDPKTRLAECRTEVNGEVTVIQQRYFDTYEVETLLNEAGFSEVVRWDASRDLGMTGDVSLGRFFYQCFR